MADEAEITTRGDIVPAQPDYYVVLINLDTPGIIVRRPVIAFRVEQFEGQHEVVTPITVHGDITPDINTNPVVAILQPGGLYSIPDSIDQDFTSDTELIAFIKQKRGR